MKCPNCGYEHPVVRGALGDNEWWWMQCPKCGYLGHPAGTEEEARKNWETEV